MRRTRPYEYWTDERVKLWADDWVKTNEEILKRLEDM